MASKTAYTSGLFTGSIWEASVLATKPAPTATGTTVTTSGIFTAAFTAPNTSNKTTGSWFYWNTAPTTNKIITLQEATVDTACTVTVPAASIVQGWNYIRFPTPYQWTSTAAGRYRFKIASATSSDSTMASSGGLAVYMDTYDSTGTIGSTDDGWIGGLIGATTTQINVEISGTSNVCGSGAEKTPNSVASTGRTGNAGLIIANGGRLWSDGTVANTLQVRGYYIVGNGGTVDRPAHPTDFTVVTKTILDCDTANGNYYFGTQDGAVVDMSGAVSDTPYAEYVSGTGTSASHFTVDRDTDWVVGMQLLIEGNTYNQVEVRYIKAVYNAREFQLSTTAGGAEAALTNAHTATSTVAMITRNNVIEQTNSTFGSYFYNSITTRANCNFNWARWNDMSFASGVGGFNLRPQSASTNFDGTSDYMVFSGGNSNRNGWLSITTASSGTDTGLVFYLSPSSNAGSGAITLGSSTGRLTNQTFNDFLVFSSVGQTMILTSAFNNEFNNCRFIGSNTGNNSTGHAVAMINSGVNTFNNCRFNTSRGRAIYASGAVKTEFNDCTFADIGTNEIDVYCVSDTYNEVIFNNCLFNSATLISNYLNQLEGSDIAFQNMDGSTSKHRWYTNHGSAWSSGTGLTDTTVRTASSLALAIKPEDNTNGFVAYLKIPANPTAQSGISGYMYRNATFSSGTLKVELFLPGTLLSATPDASYTFPTTTGSWLPFNISAYYSSSATRYATVRITAVTATAGAYAFLDDLYDAGTSNKVAGLDLWDVGHISPIMVQYDFSVVPSAVWGYSDSNTQANTMGQRQVDAADDAELAAIK